jgi:hypothetical protein
MCPPAPATPASSPVLTAFAAIKADGSISAWGNTANGGTGAPTGTGYTDISFNQSAFAAIKADGSITNWGSATSGGAGSTNAPKGSGFTNIAEPLVDGPVWQGVATGALPTAYVGKNVAQPGVNGVNAYEVGAYGLNMTSAITAGSLPAGLTLDRSTGFLSGAPTQAGTYSFTVTSSNDAGSASKTFNLEVLAPAGGTVTPLASVLDSTLPSPLIAATGKTRTPISLDVAGATGYKFAITLGALPNGITLDELTGDLSGTPQSVGENYFTVAASSPDGVITKGYRMAVLQAPAFISADAAIWVPGQASSFQVKSSGIQAPVLSMAGSLPAGLTFDPPTGVIYGTTTAAPGIYPVTVTSTNAAGVATQTLNATVSLVPAFTSANTLTFENGSTGTFVVSASGFPKPTLSLSSGTLPAG